MSKMIMDVEAQCAVILKSVNSLSSTTFSAKRKSGIRETIEEIEGKLAKIKKSIFARTGRGQQLTVKIQKNASSIVRILKDLKEDASLEPTLDTQLNELKFSVDTMEREIRQRTIVVT